MDFLKSYGSSSESDCEEMNNTTFTEHHDSKLPDHPKDEKKNISDVISDESIDFFGLVSSNKSINKSKGNCNGKSKIPGGVEVPDGRYWGTFIPESFTNTSNKHSHNKIINDEKIDSNYLKSCCSTSNSSSNVFALGSSLTSLSKKCQIPNTKKRESAHRRIKKNSDSSFFNLEKNYLSTYKAQKFVKRKIYYVHSKVSQQLSGTTLNKPFKKQSHFWKAHNGPISGLDWNIPSYSHLLVTAGLDAAVQIWNVWSDLNYKLATFTHHKKAVKNVEWFNKGSNLLSCSYDCTALVTDVETGKILALCEHADYVTACHGHAFNPHLFISGSENIILMWDSRVPQAPVNHFTYKDKFGQVQDLLFIANGDELVSCTDIVSRDSSDRSILIWDTRSNAVLSNQIFHERYSCTRLKLHPNNLNFLAQSQGNYIARFSTLSPYKMDKSKCYGCHKVDGYNIGFDISPDGSLVYSGSSQGGVYCYSQHNGRVICQLSHHDEVILDVMCHPVLPSVVACSTWGGDLCLFK